MDKAVTNVLAEYERRAQQESPLMQSLSEGELISRIDEFLISVGPDTGKLMHMLAISSNAQRMIEVGTSYGYSTVWLADAARATGGKVHSFELSTKKVEYARVQLKTAGLEGWVEFHVGDARETLAKFAEPMDFVLLDLWKHLYIPCFELVYPKLAPGAFLIADNMLQPALALEHAQAYRDLVGAKDDLDTVLLPIGSGVELSKKR